jgi:thiol:disulfide interchange protein
VARAAALVLVLAMASWSWPLLQGDATTHTADATAAQDTGAAASIHASANVWHRWSPESFARVRAEGTPVFVDFTAAWCVTCQLNKRVTLSDSGLAASFRERQVVLMRADWTRRDPAVTDALRALGRSGVPVYALYGPGAGQPQLLSEILTVSEIRDAMARWPAGARDTAALQPRLP